MRNASKAQNKQLLNPMIEAKSEVYEHAESDDY